MNVKQGLVLVVGVAAISLTSAVAVPAQELKKNWGTWGPDDQLGTLNWITPEKIVAAARLVKQGKVFSLSQPLQADEPAWTGRFMRLAMERTAQNASKEPGLNYADSYYIGFTSFASHWDALSHIWVDNKLYNGYNAEEVITEAGVSKLSIMPMVTRSITRGVLLDVARYKGVDNLASGYVITVADLEGTAKAQNVEVGRGDALLIRTGWYPIQKESGKVPMETGTPGLGLESAQWIKKMEVSILASDTGAVEVVPWEEAYMKAVGVPFAPLHGDLITNWGIMKGDQLLFDDLAEDSAKDGVYEFLFVAAPLPLVGAPVAQGSPLAIK